MTPAQLALQILPIIGVRSLDTAAAALNGISLGDGDLDAVAIALTQALQEISGLGPVAIFEQRHDGILRPPQTVTFTATKYESTIGSFATWATWMKGCTIQGSDDDDNELLSATELRRPYMGDTGSVSATVYADAILLPTWVKNTIEPVEMPRVNPLARATNREEFRYWNTGNGCRGNTGTSYYTTRNKTTGDPCVYFVEPRYDPSAQQLPIYMRFNPMPAQAYPVTFKVRRKPPIVTANDITVTGTVTPDIGLYLRPDSVDAPETSFSLVDLVIPTDWHESILLPFAKKWFLSHPAINNAPAAAQILEQYRLAKLNLESFAPQISPVQGHYQ